MKEKQAIHAPAFNDHFIAFAENRLQNWMESQDPSTPANLTELSKAVILYERLRKMRQQQESIPDHLQTAASLPERPRPATNTVSAPSLAQSSLSPSSQLSPVSSSHITSSLAASQTQSTTRSPQAATPSPQASPTSKPRSSISLLDIDPALLARDPKDLLKEAEAMLRNLRPNRKKRQGHQHRQSLPLAIPTNSRPMQFPAHKPRPEPAAPKCVRNPCGEIGMKMQGCLILSKML